MQEIHISQLTPDRRNLNKGTKRGHHMIERSIDRCGLGRSILVDKHGRIIAGNQTTQKAGEMGFENVVLVPSDGKTLVAVQRTDLDLETDEEARLLAIADNRSTELGYELDATQMRTLIEDGLDVSDFYFEDEVEDIFEQAEGEFEDIEFDPLSFDGEDSVEEPEKEQHSDKAEVSDRMPDPSWVLDLYGIPCLDLDLQGTEASLSQVWKWGAKARTDEHPGTIHHYTSDYKFAGHWSDPYKLIGTRCDAIVEVNYSTSEGMPEAMALYGIYKKRWLARLWQEAGIRVFVDVNVEPELYELNFLGVPKEWRAFATRFQSKLPDGRECGPDMVIGDWEACHAHTGTDDFLFVVFGGTSKAAQLCQERGWLHFEEDSKAARSKTDG